MAQLLKVSDPSPPGRISQLLPTVKCSTCNQPVPLDQLGDHVCSAIPSPLNPSATSLFPRSQDVVSHVDSKDKYTPPQSVTTRRSRTSTVSRDTHSSYSTLQSDSFPQSPVLRLPLSPTTISDSRTTLSSVNSIYFPLSRGTSAGPSMPASPRSHESNAYMNRSHLVSDSDRGTSNHSSALLSQGRASDTSRIRTPSNASGSSRDTLHRPSNRPRAESVKSESPSLGSVAPETRVHTPSGVFTNRRRLDSASTDHSKILHQPQHSSSLSQRPSNTSDHAGHHPSQATSSSAQAYAHYTQHVTPHLDIDTKSGGEAGMAGVGRRGFAAVARAAMFANTGVASPKQWSAGTGRDAGCDGQTSTTREWLGAPHTSKQLPSASPHSPPDSLPVPYLFGSPSARGDTNDVTLPSPAIHLPSDVDPDINGSPVSRTYSLPSPRIPNSIPFPTEPSPPFMVSEEPKTPTTPTMPFFERYQKKVAGTDATLNLDDGKLRMSPASESEYGLAYADTDTADEDGSDSKDEQSRPLWTKGRKSDGGDAAGFDMGMQMLLRSPTNGSVDVLSDDDSGTNPSIKRMKLPTRAHTTPTQRESKRVGSGGFGLGTRRGGTISGALPGSSNGERGWEGPVTGNPDRNAAPKTNEKRQKERICVKCMTTIDDGRWIRVESGNGVLCDSCWKGMYLPKCRRCNQPIEKQAVSSSDGQLKGKYHRYCFNCHKCQTAFPDRTFYVLDGKPYCAYHYHEANNSLCAAASCGVPIEGPCAVSHTGSRYHPEHLVCEFREKDVVKKELGGYHHGVGAGSCLGKSHDSRSVQCTERLVEYWEVDGCMLCEQHMRYVVSLEDGLTVPGSRGKGARDTWATKRVTRFIDIAGLGKVE